MAIISPLCHVGCYRLIRHNHRAAGLRHLAHLAIEVFDGTCSVLTEHQSTDTVLRSVATTVVILHVTLRVCDTDKTLYAVVLGFFMGNVSKI